MTGFTNVFDINPVIPSEFGYSMLTLSANTTLVWPSEIQTSTNVLTAILEVNPSGAGYAITLPSASQVSDGQANIIRNLSNTYTFQVKDAAGTLLATLAVNGAYYFYVTANTSAAGTWQSFVFGNITAVTNPSTFAGPGLTVVGTTLGTAVPVTQRAATWTMTAPGRAELNRWSGGAGTWNLLAAATAGNNFWASAVNQGSGTLTVDPSGGELINGAATLAVAPGESVIIACDGTGWYTVSYSRSITASITLLSLTGLDGTLVTLNSTQAANAIIFCTGALLANQRIEFPAIVGRWFIRNGTTGAYTLTLATGGVDIGVTVPQSEQRPILSDGTNMYQAVTTTAIAPTSFNAGLVAAPSIFLNGTSTTGFYFPSTITTAFVAGGSEVFRMAAAGLQVNGVSLTDASNNIPWARVSNATLPYIQAYSLGM